MDAKRRKLFEWDSKKGELEVYRNSDLEHLGAFDPYTAERRGPADPKRRIYR
ncbi:MULTISPECIES: colicin E3/pyocin S6 family cytotoxin [Pseudomonas]|uniref:colicin E3/pyocin S6 family cytotoxin n=1 Tax=Pseudomonas TaxID=286 RepID=UPI001F23F3DD|nr:MULTISPECIES: colicin E3/pyocin S6 family cytotoxin [Pseudomonas]WEX19250.1 colicin E3/pyocin S6 family cytotoxin [Pseudomonas sp. G11]